jgi:hypothetical protein
MQPGKGTSQLKRLLVTVLIGLVITPSTLAKQLSGAQVKCLIIQESIANYPKSVHCSRYQRVTKKLELEVNERLDAFRAYNPAE